MNSKLFNYKDLYLQLQLIDNDWECKFTPKDYIYTGWEEVEKRNLNDFVGFDIVMAKIRKTICGLRGNRKGSMLIVGEDGYIKWDEVREYLYALKHYEEQNMAVFNMKKISAVEFIKDYSFLKQMKPFTNHTEECFRNDLANPNDYLLTDYLTLLGEYLIDLMEDYEQEYHLKIEVKASNIIKNAWLSAKYSPYTKLGKARFDKEREELFS